MKLHVLFGQRKQRYDGEFAPEALDCWDECSIDQNPAGFEQSIAGAMATYTSEMSAMRVIVVEVDGDKIERLLNRAPAVAGTVEDP
jgi:hypothetical protein